MKKLIIGIMVCLIVFAALCYLLIPNTIVTNQSAILHYNIKSLRRVIYSNENWHKWWPATTKDTASVLSLNGNKYTVSDKTMSSIFINVDNEITHSSSSLTFIPLAKDSVKLDWNLTTATSSNPFKRLEIYFKTKSLQQDLGSLLSHLKSYYSNTQNIYGLDIQRELVKDPLLVFTSDSSITYPSTEKIYSLIEALRNYVSSQHAQAIDSPMMNVYAINKQSYFIKVAIPVDRVLPSSGKITYKQMLGGGNILTANVTGNQQMADSALATIETYISDYQLTAPAIPFFSLKTNRMAIKNSENWITKVYYPVMFY